MRVESSLRKISHLLKSIQYLLATKECTKNIVITKTEPNDYARDYNLTVSETGAFDKALQQ